MNNKHKKTLEKIFQDPIKPLEWQRIEKLLIALGAEVFEGKGSRVSFVLNDIPITFHRPHPEKEVKKYQIKNVREFLTVAGIDVE